MTHVPTSAIGLFGQNFESPFDAIKREDELGEYWTGRDLQPVMGYSIWRDFTNAVERAMVACHNSGADPARHFADARKVSPSGPAAADYRLTRYGAYLVAMNGDPRKIEIAEAQTYFAVKTREAETAPARELTGPELLARAVIEAQSMLAAKDERIAELEPRAEVAGRLLDAEGDLSVGDTAKALTRGGVKTGERLLYASLHRLGWIYRGGDNRWRVKQSAINTGCMSVIPQSHYHPRTGVLVLDAPQPRVTPKGIQKLLTVLGTTDLAVSE